MTGNEAKPSQAMGATADSTDFDKLVRFYERLGEPMSYPFAAQVLDLTRLAPGERVIDVATGTGVLAVAAAERRARVLATDIAPAMVAHTADRLRRFDGCEARMMSLDALDVPDAQFDAAFSLFGILAFSTWPKGLSELVRVTRPGGRIAVTIWVERKDATPAYVLKRVFEDCFPGRELWPKAFFPSWSAHGLGDALREAGCDAVEVKVCSADWRPVSAAGGPVYPANALDEGDAMFRNFPGYAALADEDRERLRAPLAEAFAAEAGADGAIRLPTEAFVATGRRSA